MAGGKSTSISLGGSEGSKSPESTNRGNKRNKEFDVVKRHEQNNNALNKAKTAEGNHISIATTVEILMNHRGAKFMARVVQGVEK